MFIHFFCLCPLSLTVKLNFNISKVAYWIRGKEREGGREGGVGLNKKTDNISG